MFIYISHLARISYEGKTLQRLIDNLNLTEMLIIVDYKMKLKSLFFRESMSQYFAKRGMSLLGAAVITRKVDGLSSYHAEFFDLVCDDSTEDSFAVASSLEGILKKLKEKSLYQNIQSFILYSDGAGCFIGTDLLFFLPSFAQSVGFKCSFHHTSESGDGKTFLDCHFSYDNEKILSSVIAGEGENDVTNAATAVKALMFQGPISNSTAYEIRINRALQPKSITAIKDITTFRQREFLYEGNKVVAIHFHRQSFRKKTLSWDGSQILAHYAKKKSTKRKEMSILKNKKKDRMKRKTGTQCKLVPNTKNERNILITRMR